MERILVSRRLAETYHDGDGAYLHDGRSARKFLRCRQCARNRNAVIQGGRIHSVECRLLLGSQHVRRTWRPKSGDMVIRPDAPQRSRNQRRPRCQLRAMRSRHRITAVANIPALPVTPSRIGRGGLQSSGKSTKHGLEHKNICIFEFLYYLCTRNEQNGALVQLVRIRACHARGQGFESPTHRRVRRNKPKKPCKRIVYKAFSLFAADAGFVLREIPDARGECDRPRQTDKKAVAGINSGKSHPAPYPPPTPPDGRSRRR